jgi:hypothetical protein
MAEHICLVLISPLGELTSMVCFMVAIDRLCFATKLDVINEYDVPESNKQLQDMSLQETYPVPHLGLAELHLLSYGLPCHTYNSAALVALSDFWLQEMPV